MSALEEHLGIRLFQLGNARVPAGQNLAELIDHRGRRRVDQAFFVVKTDHPPRALGDRREVEGFSVLDQIEADAVH